jgi:predicted Zn-dependent peptidase
LEKLRRDPPDAREVQRAINQVEASFYRRMERVSNKADSLNGYYFSGGGPDYFAEDLARYTSLSPSDVQAAALRWLPADRRVELVVEPEVKK